MTTRRSIIIIIIAAIVALALQVLLGAFLSARLSTWSFLQRIKFINPQAPIVINNREVVRVSDSGDLVDVVNKVKPKISSLVAIQNGALSVVGTAVNITADGVFLTSYGSFSSKAQYAVVLNDGRTSAVKEIVSDPATRLSFLTTYAAGVSIAAFASSKDLSAGEKVALINSSQTPLTARFSVGYIGASQEDMSSQGADASHPGRSFLLNPGNGSAPGSVVANVSGEVVGIWTGERVISSDVIKQLLPLYFAQKTRIARPSFGFSYEYLTQPQANLLATSPGAQIKSVDKAKANLPAPAASAGLQPGDVIIEANGSKIDRPSALEEVTEQIKPGQSLVLNVVRGTGTLSLTLIAGELK